MVDEETEFGIQNGLNVARASYTEDQILTDCILADKTGYDSIFYIDHTNVPQWKNVVVLDPWVMLSAIAAVTQNVELGTCVTDAIRRHPSNIALDVITLEKYSKLEGVCSQTHLTGKPSFPTYTTISNPTFKKEELM